MHADQKLKLITTITYGCHVLPGNNNMGNFVKDFQNTIPTKFGSNWPSSQEKICFVYCSIRHKNSVLWPCYFSDQNVKVVFCR